MPIQRIRKTIATVAAKNAAQKLRAARKAEQSAHWGIKYGAQSHQPEYTAASLAKCLSAHAQKEQALKKLHAARKARREAK